ATTSFFLQAFRVGHANYWIRAAFLQSSEVITQMTQMSDTYNGIDFKVQKQMGAIFHPFKILTPKKAIPVDMLEIMLWVILLMQ
ncbi:hypothetical protein DOY81_011317, partial [Sarcophaga bullata]